MKKQFLKIIIIVSILLTILPTVALAETIEYGIWVGKTRVTSVNASDVLKDRKVSYDAESKTLTLNNATIDSKVGHFRNIITSIYITQDVTIQLIGDNVIGPPTTELVDSSCGIYNSPDTTLTIKGPGTLSVQGGPSTGDSVGISLRGSLVIDNCDVKTFSEGPGNRVYGIYDWLQKGIIVKNGASLIAFSNYHEVVDGNYNYIGCGYRPNGTSSMITVDSTSRVIFKGVNYAAEVPKVQWNYNFLKASTYYDGKDAEPIDINYDNYQNYKYIEIDTYQAPNVESLTFTPPQDLTYDNKAKHADVSSPLYEGAITVKYYKDDELLRFAPINVGTYTVKVDVRHGNVYGGDITKENWRFTITPLDISSGAHVDQFYFLRFNGMPQTPSATVMINDLRVTGTWSNVTNVGGKTSFTANGNFTGTISNYDTGMLKATPSYITPTGLTANYGQTLADISLPAGFAWENPNASVGNIGAKSFKAIYTPADTNNYVTVSNILVNIRVNKALTIDEIPSVTYNGLAHTPEVIVKDGENPLIKDVNYTVSYNNNINAGTATVNVVGIGNYAGSNGTKTFIINRGEQAAPTGITKLNVTTKGGNDAKILNVNTNMEYKKDDGEYIEITGSEISGLSKGEYSIRYKQTELYNASLDYKITIDEPAVIKTDENIPEGIEIETPIQSSYNITIKLAIASVAPEIQALSNNKVMASVFDITAEVNSLPKSVLSNIIKITLPLPEAARGKNITVYRLHDGVANVIPTGEENKNADGEYAVVGTESIVIYAKNFSQYAIAYVNTSNSDSGTYTKYYEITVTQSEGGVISPGTVSVAEFGRKTFTIKPNDGYEIKDVLVNGKSVGKVSEYTFTNIESKATITAVFGKIESNVTWENPFIDVNINDWFFEAVKCVHENGLMKGTKETIFDPNTELTRAMFVTVLYRIENEPNTNEVSFTDIESGSYYEKAVAWAVEKGITKGVSSTSFEPNSNITREQLATFIQRYAAFKGLDTTVYKNENYVDSDKISDFAKDAVAYCTENGIMSGKGDKIFAPGDYATRAEIAAVLERMLKIMK